MLNAETVGGDPWGLGWHWEWVRPTAEQHAQQAFLAAHTLPAEPAREIFEDVGAALMADIDGLMSGIEDPGFISYAQSVARELYFRRLCELVATSPEGGHA